MYESTLLRVAIAGLTSVYRNAADDVEGKARKIIITHALAAAAAAVASGWIPGAGSAVATTIGVGFTCAMYYRLANLFDIRIRRNILKTIASVLIAELAAYFAVVLVGSAVLSFVPFVGNLSASTFCAIVNFALVYAAAYLYIKLLTRVFLMRKDPDEMTEEDWKEAAKRTAGEEDIKNIVKEAKSVHKSVKNDKEYSDYKDVQPME